MISPSLGVLTENMSEVPYHGVPAFLFCIIYTYGKWAVWKHPEWQIVAVSPQLYLAGPTDSVYAYIVFIILDRFWVLRLLSSYCDYTHSLFFNKSIGMGLIFEAGAALKLELIYVFFMQDWCLFYYHYILSKCMYIYIYIECIYILYSPYTHIYIYMCNTCYTRKTTYMYIYIYIYICISIYSCWCRVFWVFRAALMYQPCCVNLGHESFYFLAFFF